MAGEVEAVREASTVDHQEAVLDMVRGRQVGGGAGVVGREIAAGRGLRENRHARTPSPFFTWMGRKVKCHAWTKDLPPCFLRGCTVTPMPGGLFL